MAYRGKNQKTEERSIQDLEDEAIRLAENCPLSNLASMSLWFAGEGETFDFVRERLRNADWGQLQNFINRFS